MERCGYCNLIMENPVALLCNSNHLFHEECLNYAFTRELICPKCKQENINHQLCTTFGDDRILNITMKSSVRLTLNKSFDVKLKDNHVAGHEIRE